jgi:PilZ domain
MASWRAVKELLEAFCNLTIASDPNREKVSGVTYRRRPRGLAGVTAEPRRMVDEKRRAVRQRVLKAGTIVIKGAGTISCTVRNMSESGASLEVASLLDIPDIFTLLIANDHTKRPCRVVWRRGQRIGIQFL